MNPTVCAFCGVGMKPGAVFCSACGRSVATSQPPQSPPLPQTPSLGRQVRNPMSRQAKRAFTVGALVIFTVFTVIFIRHLPGGDHPVIANQPEVAMAAANIGLNLVPHQIDFTVHDGNISFSLTDLLQYKMVSFDYVAPSATVPIIAFISPSGKLITAIRFCDPCNSKSFRIDGNELVCGVCETRWKLSNLEGVSGSCQKYPPDPIPSRVDGNRVVIDESLVKQWKMRI
jgi:uncharacterized Zn finger protein (UPF0148 family)